MNPRLSIIIVSWNVKSRLEACIRSILNSRFLQEKEIIIIDNASTDETPKLLKKFSANNAQIKIILSSKNLGFARANNLALKQASGDFVLFLNPDTEVFPDTLEKSCAYLEQNIDVDIVGIKHLNFDTTLQPSVRRHPNFWVLSGILLKLHHVFNNAHLFRQYFVKDFDYEKTQVCEQIAGSFFLARKKVCDNLKGFDEKFFLWFEEVDLCARAIKNNYRIQYFSDAAVIHFGGQSFSQLLGFRKQQIFNASARIYAKKHFGHLAYFSLWILEVPSIILAIISSLFL